MLMKQLLQMAWMGMVAKGANHVIRGQKISGLLSDLQRGNRDLRLNQTPMVNGLISYACVKAPKNPKRKRFRELPGW